MKHKFLHDTHFHLDLYKNIPEIIKEIDDIKCYTIAVTNLPELYYKLIKNITSKYVRVALGFHPELVYEYQKQTELMWESLGETKYIGEVGLDYKNKKQVDIAEQKKFFQELVTKCNTYGDKIMTLHSRKSEKDVVDIIGNKFNGHVILHWYSGNKTVMDKAIINGFYFSVNIAMVRSKSGQNIISNIPLNKILLESDGPFVKIDNNSIRPIDITNTVEALSKLLNINTVELESMLKNNFKVLLNS